MAMSTHAVTVTYQGRVAGGTSPLSGTPGRSDSMSGTVNSALHAGHLLVRPAYLSGIFILRLHCWQMYVIATHHLAWLPELRGWHFAFWHGSIFRC